MLGKDVVGSTVVEEAAAIARVATEGLGPQGRPLYAAHAELAWPDEPHLVLWHAVTLLREYRGDGHVVALLRAGVPGLEALITHTATGRGFTAAAAKATRGWSDDEWTAGEARLRASGMLADDGLTEAGIELRASIEQATDELAAEPWLAIGPSATDRLIELGRGLSRRLVAAGAFSGDVFARPAGQ
jgi:hypothetical protein